MASSPLASLMAACDAAGAFQELYLEFCLPRAAPLWLDACVCSLQRLSLYTQGRLIVGAPLQAMSGLLELELGGEAVRLRCGVCLPPLLTRLAWSSDTYKHVVRQLQGLTGMKCLVGWAAQHAACSMHAAAG